MTDDRLQPIDPSKAKEMYLRQREADVSDRTRQAHDYRLRHFIRWCDRENVENLNELTGRDIHEFRLWRRDDGGLNAVSLKTQLQTLRVFLRFCESIDAVHDGLSDLVRLPTTEHADERSREMLPSERATEILEHLRQFAYASRGHVVIELLWHTGMRMGAAHALDVSDYDSENAHVAVRHRPDTETALKNQAEGERLVALAPHVCDTVDDWLQHHRPDVTDEHGREPLLTTRHGRMAQSSLRGLVYKLTRPCFRGDDCPHGRNMIDCAGTDAGAYSRCPSSVSPHPIRRGSITYHLSSDVPENVVSDRMNVGQDVLEKHYDERTEEQRVEQRRGYLDNL